MIAAVPSAIVHGAEGRKVVVEVHVSNGLPGFTIVGLPDPACREARDRVRAALLSSGLGWPNRRVTVNLAPSGVRKAGAGLDLPIAIGVLLATEELAAQTVAGYSFIGELGLDGAIRPVPGVLPVVSVVGTDSVVVPAESVTEALLIGGPTVRTARCLAELVACLRGQAAWRCPEEDGRIFGRGGFAPALGGGEPLRLRGGPGLDLADVRGQIVGRQAIEVAAAGGHHLLLSGPPGSGKTMLAERVVGILPRLEREEIIETCRIHSAAGLPLPTRTLRGEAPFRAPHHTSSAVSLLGGGSAWLRPGEVSLATNGVLFLDELPEFPSAVLDCLRQPLEEGVVRVSRARLTAELPAHFLLLAAMNPCPCGDGAGSAECRCSAAQIDRYRRRLSGPLLDRFDLHVVVNKLSKAELFGTEPGESSEAVRSRVLAARALAQARGVPCNAAIPANLLEELAPLEPKAKALLQRRLDRSEITARGLDRVRRVARTIADLMGCAGPVPPEAAAAALELRAGRRVLQEGGGRRDFASCGAFVGR
jgi:magnesium chelatase family protein